MTFYFDSLDSADFEYLSKDIAEILTGTKLRCYPSGPDGGIDASDFYCENFDEPSVIVQAKHWEHTSSFSKLKAAFESLVLQLKKYALLDPQFFLFTTQRVARNKQEELLSIAMKAGFNRFTILERESINDILEEERCRNIVRKHFKLWLNHTSILSEIDNREKFIDCEVFLDGAVEQRQLFVQTSIFDESVRCLKEGHIVAIVGDPGTGKTTLTKMLALYFAGDGYTVFYTTSSKADDAKRLLSADPEARELVVLDDFLGQRCLDVNAPQLRSISSLITYIRKSKNRKIVVNSRLTILNEAFQNDSEFHKLMQSLDDSTVITNTNRLTKLDRAQILHSNFLYYKVPQKYIQNVAKLIGGLKARGYMLIAGHRNYNPRIIEYVCSEDVYSSVSSSEYWRLIWKILHNPSEVWKNEFSRRLDSPDRALMYTLFSISDRQVEEESLKEAFEKRAFEDSAIDTTRGAYEASSLRLKDAMLRSSLAEKKNQVSISNPSINDYISSYLSETDSEAASIIRTATYTDQIYRISRINKSKMVKRLVFDMIIDGSFFALPSLEADTNTQFLRTIMNLGLIKNDISEQIESSILNILDGSGYKFTIGTFAKTVIDAEIFISDPDTVGIFGRPDVVEDMLSQLDLDDAAACYRLSSLVVQSEEDTLRITSAALDTLAEKISDKAFEFLDNDLTQKALELAEDFFDIGEGGYYDRETGDLHEFSKKCYEYLDAETKTIRSEVQADLETDALFSEKELDNLIKKEMTSMLDGAWPFDWVFNYVVNPESPEKREHIESDEENLIDRIFSEYISAPLGQQE